MILPWPAIAHIWLWWLGVPVLCFFAFIPVKVACLLHGRMHVQRVQLSQCGAHQ